MVLDGSLKGFVFSRLGELDTNSWDVWSVCECNHDLKLPDGSGVRSRQLKCRRDCPNSVECPNTVQYGTCNCSTGKLNI